MINSPGFLAQSASALTQAKAAFPKAFGPTISPASVISAWQSLNAQGTPGGPDVSGIRERLMDIISQLEEEKKKRFKAGVGGKFSRNRGTWT